MRCFTDPELTLGINAVLGTHRFGMRTDADWLAIFLEAAQAPAITHPMTCACGRQLTDAHGVALVPIAVRDRRWRCQTCVPA